MKTFIPFYKCPYTIVVALILLIVTVGQAGDWVNQPPPPFFQSSQLEENMSGELSELLLSDLESGIKKILIDKSLSVRLIELTDDEKTIKGPAANVAVLQGDFSRISQVTWRCDVTVYVTIIVPHVKSEEARRTGLYPLLMGVTGLLTGQKLIVVKKDEQQQDYNYTVPVKPLKPTQWRQVKETKVFLAFTHEFKTSFTYKRSEEQADRLLAIGLEFYADAQNGEKVTEAEIDLS